ncbi:class I SAM-dependent methyltransferase [Aurantiacibacter aquimixticola]|uniref:Methyltransferase n=1 Tax=Aurantiacibacter aquimixticola TaxID=1958945 RepID=A0A419RVE5_9SPHN|nr:class I SAM-dependent methyltransferase [Aurantiacibacter aquimixticola]RJY09748.1 methyltransferase [Aurantiacibacter aquimixticola]
MRLITLTAAALVLAGCAQDAPEQPEASAEYSPDRYRQAVSDIARTDDVAQDDARKPAELLAFAQIDSGDVVGDFIMGGGYVTRLLATAVGGDGRVYAFQPEEFIAFNADYAADQDQTVRRYSDNDGNPIRVFALRAPLTAPGWPEPLDTIVTVMNLHDLWLEQFPEDTPERTARMLFDALKPGGTLVVVDHLAAEGGGAEAANTLHRMDREMAMRLLTDAGFELEAESDLYARPGDPRTANVFDDEIRGRTDQFAWRLRKPE